MNDVMVSTSLKVQNFACDDEKPEPRTKFNALNFFSEEIDWTKLKYDLNQIDWNEKLNMDDPQEILENINQICLDVCRERIPKITRRNQRLKDIAAHSQNEEGKL